MELVCPAGSLSALKVAVDSGADAVYIGFKDDTNARHFAGLNFADKKAQDGMSNIKRMEEKTEEECKKCKSHMVVKWGKNGSFLGCSAYPDCSYTVPYERKDGKIVVLEQKEITNVNCKSCGAKMGLKRGKFGEFLGCSRYPDCTTTMPIPTNVKCPKEECDGDIVSKRTKRGRIFYGCGNYPNCDFTLWQKPVDRKCEVCDSPYLLEKSTRDVVKWQCPECKGIISPDSDDSK